jgi:hypothetical protein
MVNVTELIKSLGDLNPDSDVYVSVNTMTRACGHIESARKGWLENLPEKANVYWGPAWRVRVADDRIFLECEDGYPADQ